MAIGQLERNGAAEPLHEINVTPLVDVMLVLLIIFIVTAPLLTHKVKLNLPKAKTEASAVLHPLVVSMTRDTDLYLDGQPIAAPDLEIHLKHMVTSGAEPTVEVRADGELAYQYVVRLMALVQNAGVTKISFITQPGVNNTAFPQTTPPSGDNTAIPQSRPAQQPAVAK